MNTFTIGPEKSLISKITISEKPTKDIVAIFGITSAQFTQ